MSKAKGYGIRKSKLRKSLRRTETRHKIQDRIYKAQNGIYSQYWKGYWIDKDEKIGKIEYITVPEHIEIKEQIVGWYYEKMWDEEEMCLIKVKRPLIHKVQVLVPTYTYKKHRKVGERLLPIYPQRCNQNFSKFVKHRRERQLRHTPIENVYNNGNYKKLGKKR